MDQEEWEDLVVAWNEVPPLTRLAEYALGATLTAAVPDGPRAPLAVEGRLVVLVALALYYAAWADEVTELHATRIAPARDALAKPSLARQVAAVRPALRKPAVARSHLRDPEGCGVVPPAEAAELAAAVDDVDEFESVRTRAVAVLEAALANSRSGRLVELHTPMRALRVRACWLDRALPPVVGPGEDRSEIF